MPKSQHEKKLEAEDRANRWLADANKLAESGKSVQAEKAYDKSQYWLDRYNRLASNC